MSAGREDKLELENVTYEAVQRFFANALSTHRYQLLGLAYNYGTKRVSFDWLVDELFQPKWGLTKPSGVFNDLASVQRALLAQANRVPYLLIREIVERAMVATDLKTRYVSRYKQLWVFDQLLTAFEAKFYPTWLAWMNTNNDGLAAHFTAIMHDVTWSINVGAHLPTLRAALRDLMLGLARQINVDLASEKRLDKLFKKLVASVQSECAAPMDLMTHYLFIKHLAKLDAPYHALRFQDVANGRFMITEQLVTNLARVAAALNEAKTYCPIIN